MRALVLVALVVAAAHACCYTLQTNPAGADIPVYTWYLDMQSPRAVRPTDCVGQLHAVDQRSGPALSACEMIGVQYQPMNAPQAVWRELNVTDVQRVLFTQPCVGFGPFRAGDPASSILQHKLSDSWVQLQLRCDDSPFDSCVRFGLRLRQSAQAQLVIEQQLDTQLESCVRSASPSVSARPTPSVTPTPSRTPSATPLPVYSSVFRVEATLNNAVFISLQLGLNYQLLKDSGGAAGARWCAAPVLNAERTAVQTTLYAEVSADERRRGHLSHSIVDAAKQTLAGPQSALAVTVLWTAGGFCRVSLTADNVLTFLGCRLFIGDAVYETVSWSHVETLDSRVIMTCDALEPQAAPESPVVCDISLGWTVDPVQSLVVLRGADAYAEARLAWMGCTDGSKRPRIDYVSPLLTLSTRQETRCTVDDDTRTRVTCNGALLMAIAGTGCSSIESPTLTVVQACVPSSGAVLLVD